mgnify:FL=1
MLFLERLRVGQFTDTFEYMFGRSNRPVALGRCANQTRLEMRESGRAAKIFDEKHTRVVVADQGRRSTVAGWFVRGFDRPIGVRSEFVQRFSAGSKR